MTGHRLAVESLLLVLFCGRLLLGQEAVIDLRNPAGRVISFESQESLARGVADVSLVGDLNGDGVSDVGILHVTSHVPGVRSLYVIFGSAEWPARNMLGPDLPNSVRFWPDDESLAGRIDLGHVGDLDADGFDEFAFSASQYRVSPDQEFPGAIFIVYGEAGFDYSGELRDIRDGFIPGTVIFNGSDPDRGERLGINGTLGVADVNGDGRRDLMIGAWSGDNFDNRDYVHVLLDARSIGARVDLKDLGDSLPGFTIVVPGTPYNVSDAGDIDGDGYHDILMSRNVFPRGGSSFSTAVRIRGESITSVAWRRKEKGSSLCSLRTHRTQHS